jgi:methylated-DNA-protein-cysteine methyltransferase-like protein
MSPFEAAVLEVLHSLQPGEVVTYGEVAEMAAYPGRARAVGTILRLTGEDVPWWRVVGSGGRLISPHPEEQARLLAAEAILAPRETDHMETEF